MLRPLEDLASEFERVVEHEDRRNPYRRRLLVPGIAAGLATAAVAVAATGILDGDPLPAPRGAHPRPNVGGGVPLAGQGPLLALRVQDPDGGPPWGMRVVRLTRGQGCLQVGRVVRNRIGVLGRDGRFHERTPTSPPQFCEPLDRHGRLFTAISLQGASADGAFGAHGQLRNLFFGTVGPRAVRVRFRDEAGSPRSQQVAGPDGAYLVVRRARPNQEKRGTFTPSQTPVSGLTSIIYRDGDVCRLRRNRPCPRRGYVYPRTRRPSQAELSTLVRATVSRPRVPRDAPPGSRPQRIVRVRFKARVPGDRDTNYSATLNPGGTGPRCGGITVGSLQRDVAAGHDASIVFYVDPSCHGAVTGVLRYGPTRSRNPMSGAVAGRYTARLP